jgi:pullulanase
MYESFGAVVTGKQVEFRVFFPDNSLDPSQYQPGRGGLPQIKEIRVVGTFQSQIGGKNFDPQSAPVMKKSRFNDPVGGNPIGWLYSLKIDKNLSDAYYQYKYFVTFENNRTGFCGDPCTKLTGEGDFENSAFVIGGNSTTVNPVSKRISFHDLIIYELMVDDFSARIRDGKAPLEAVKDRIPYLKDLGINAIEFMPLTGYPGKDFNWGYEPIYFFAVENRYTESASSPLDRIYKLKSLINELHKEGIHVILDGVFNHAAKREKNSGFPYHFLYQNPEDSPFTGEFSDTFAGLEDLDFHNKCTQQFIFDVCKYWLDMFQFDGIRYDFTLGYLARGNANQGISRLVKDLNQYLVETGRSSIPQMLEHLTDNRFDAINDTNQIEATSCWFDIFLIKHHEYLRHGGNIDLNSSETLRILNSYHEYGVGRGPVTYIDNHDHSTIVNIAGESRGGREGGWFKTQPAAITLLTSPGAVLIRNGQEFGEDYCLTPPGQDEKTHPCGQRVAPRPLRWDTLAQDSIGKTLFGLYKKLIQIRKDHPSLRSPNFFPFLTIILMDMGLFLVKMSLSIIVLELVMTMYLKDLL